MGKIIGIDLGTTNSVVAIMVGREPKVIVNEEGSLITPSVVAWDAQGGTLVGQIAKRQAVTNAENTIFSAKRFVGRRFDEVGKRRRDDVECGVVGGVTRRRQSGRVPEESDLEDGERMLRGADLDPLAAGRGVTHRLVRECPRLRLAAEALGHRDPLEILRENLYHLIHQRPIV